MKNKQLNRLMASLVSATLLGAASLQAQQLIWTYDTDLTTTTNPIAMAWGGGWGAGETSVWDPLDASGNPSSGSDKITANFSPGTTYDVLQNWPGPSVDLSAYNDFSIDIYMPPGATNLSPNGDYGTMYIRFRTGGAWPGVVLNFNGGNPITNAGWNHFDIPFPTLGIAPTPGYNIEWDTSYTNPATFYIDNVRFYYNSSLQPPPPPTVSLKPAVPGLNVIASTSGNSYYDRQQVRLTNTVGTAWVGHATAANPVTYSYTIKSWNSPSYGNSANGFQGQYAYLFLVPNAAIANSPDYNNDAGCQIFVIQESPTNAVLQFQYKVSLPNGNDMYYGRGNYTNAPGSGGGSVLESGNLGGVTNYAASSPGVGTWSIKFTSDTNVTLIAPNGNTASYVIPPYNISPFSADANFGIYLGNMAQTKEGLNQDIVYSGFSVTGVPSPFTDNLLADSALLPQWDPTTSAALSAVAFLPSSVKYSAIWAPQAKGPWSLGIGTNLVTRTNYSVLSTYLPIQEIGQTEQFIDAKDLPVGPAAFIQAQKLNFAMLQVLLPGETNAPGTVTGKTGTPIPVSLGAGGFVNVTVNAVDPTYHIVPGVNDTIRLTCDDLFSILPNDAALVNGSITFGVTGATEPLAFGSTGSWTVTATDTSVTNIAAVVSSPITVGP
jgi:hypothetical protein